MSELSRIEELCVEKGMKMTGQRRIIARVLSESTDHPDVEEVYRRARASRPQDQHRHGLSHRAAVRGGRTSWSGTTSATAAPATRRRPRITMTISSTSRSGRVMEFREPRDRGSAAGDRGPAWVRAGGPSARALRRSDPSPARRTGRPSAMRGDEPGETRAARAPAVRPDSRPMRTAMAAEACVSKRLYIKTYGCQMNVYDSGRLADLLAQPRLQPDRRTRRTPT